MTIDFRKLLNILNASELINEHADLIWKIRTISDEDRIIRIYNDYVNIDYTYDIYTGGTGKFRLCNVDKNHHTFKPITDAVTDMMVDYAVRFVIAKIDELVKVSIVDYIRILDY